METLKDLEPYVDATVARFVAKMQRMLPAKKALDIDMGKWLQLFAFGRASKSCQVFLWLMQNRRDW